MVMLLQGTVMTAANGSVSGGMLVEGREQTGGKLQGTRIKRWLRERVRHTQRQRDTESERVRHTHILRVRERIREQQGLRRDLVTQTLRWLR